MEIEKLRSAFSASKKCVICGIGNSDRGDDAAGPLVIAALFDKRGESTEERSSIEYTDRGKRVLIIDALTVPENYLGEIMDFSPDTLVFIDCADFNDGTVKAGSVRVFDERSLPSNETASTHSIPLSVFTAILKNRLPEMKIVIAGIQPSSVEFGAPVCGRVKEACENICVAFS